MHSDRHFGEHLILDGYKGCPDRLNDTELVKSLLHQLVAGLHMKILSGPVVCSALGNGSKDPGGLTAFVVVQESHISIHTFPAKRFLSADVYSCRNGLLQETVTRLISEAFLLGQVEIKLLKRGVFYSEIDPTNE